jgi:hypothetical protein
MHGQKAVGGRIFLIGATLTVDRTTVALTGGTPANLPYTVSVTYQ